MTTIKTILLLAVLVAGLAGFSVKQELSGNPIARYATEQFTERGQVLETLHAGSYRYLKLKTDGGRQVWVATLAATAPSADRIELVVFARARDFKSARLHRSFDELWFGAARATSVPPVSPTQKGTAP